VVGNQIPGRAYAYLVENRLIESIRDFDPECLPVNSRSVLAKLRSGDPSWEVTAPPEVVELVKRRGLLGYRAGPVADAA
jgi:hypothetical protein